MGSLWDACDHTQQYEEENNLFASLRYGDVASAGPPARPLDFPAPTVYRCVKTAILARDHRSGTIHSLENVVIRCDTDRFCRRRPTDVAYLVKKKLGKSVYGTIWLCIVLKRCKFNQQPHGERGELSEPELASEQEERIEWESTDLLVVIKSSEWKKINACRGRHLEDPIREVSAMQLLGNYHPHMVGSIEVLQDDTALYSVMKYYPDGDLYGRLVAAHSDHGINRRHAEIAANEEQARIWFRQLLNVSPTREWNRSMQVCHASIGSDHARASFQALLHLQRKGVCHRDISLENLVLDENDRLVLIDLGLSLRVPYTDPCNYGCVTDVSAGTSRRLMIAQGQGGRLMYAAPEVTEGKEIVDAFAIDLWSAGIVLFVMLVGLSPFEVALPSDRRYAKISSGHLKQVISSLDIPLSREATDLLQGFFWRDPQRRLTLAEAMEHPWIQGKRFAPTKSTTTAAASPTKPKEATKSSPTKPSHQRTTSNTQETPCKRNSQKSLSPVKSKLENRRLRFPQAPRLVQF